MVTCEYCGKQTDASFGTCPSCGAPLPAETEEEETSETGASEVETTGTDAKSVLASMLDALAETTRVYHPEPPYHPYVREVPPVRERRVHRNSKPGKPSGPGGYKEPGGHPGVR